MNIHHEIASHFAPKPLLAAEYTNGSKTRSPLLSINEIRNGRRIPQSTHKVDGKREARVIAAALGATPWNF